MEGIHGGWEGDRNVLVIERKDGFSTDFLRILSRIGSGLGL